MPQGLRPFFECPPQVGVRSLDANLGSGLQHYLVRRGCGCPIFAAFFAAKGDDCEHKWDFTFRVV